MHALRATPNALFYDQDEFVVGIDYFASNENGLCTHYLPGGVEVEVDRINCGEYPEQPIAYPEIEEEVEELMDNIISYGFDPDVVNAWF